MFHNAKLTNVDQITDLPWAGNWRDDHELANICNRFILTLTDREEQRRALVLTEWCFTGERVTVTDEDLDGFIADVTDDTEDE